MSNSSVPSSVSAVLSSITGTGTGGAPTPSFTPPPPETTTSGTTPPSPLPPNNSNQNANGGLATSASLYLYTFLATLVLLLSVSGAIVVRSFVLRRRHRRMVEEAIRNGTWVPPAPPSRPVRVDLSKKPKMWEAFIDGKGALTGMRGFDGEGGAGGAEQWYTPGGVVGAGKGVAGGGVGRPGINSDWQHEHSREWDTIKPFSAAYVAPGQDEADASSGRLGSSPSTTSINRINRSTPTTPVITPAAPREPLHRALITSARRILSPTPQPTSPLPGPSGGANNGTAGGDADPAIGAGQVMAELNSRAGKAPTAVRVAVLIAMPKPPGANESHGNAPEDEEQPLPHIEVGVAEVLVLSHQLSAGGKAESSKEKPGVRGSVGSHDSDISEV
ncbi:hypothetical protein D9619_009193 [Psilocybe cf. subviscida]|uniref:Uncharacterized protein n=1 Tax=Psilocybe cf. subviscida TaxID=2480587 RepID=A0A8H5BW69_9AGAR|nr:hypothetical protein D9619_009193 [Psilocybe cf. subviscida]